MRLLLTGATGFVGQNLIPMIFKNCPDIDIMTLNVDLDKANRKYPGNLYPSCINILSTDLEKVRDFDPEIVFHLATMTTPKNDTELIKPMLAANIEFGVSLLDILQHCPSMKLFVNLGSFAEYRLGPQKINDAYLYTATKTAFRCFCQYYSDLGCFKYITLVPYTVYGGKMTVKRIIDYLVESMNSELPIKMTEGEQILDFIHVYDVANFFVFILQNKCKFYALENGEEFHLGTGRGTSIRELASILEKKYGKKCNVIWGGIPYRKRDTMYAVAPIAKNIKELGWKAKIKLENGIDMLI